MRGRRALSLVVVSLLLLAIFSTNLRPAHALVHNVGIAMVGTTHMRPAIPTVRAEAVNETVIVTAYNNGTEDETFLVKVYYYNDTLLPQYIGNITFQLNTPSIGDRNSTEIAITWNISAIDEGAYWVKANTTAVPGDETPGDNEKISEYQTGIITGHNVGISDVKGSFPLQVRAGRDPYSITIEAYNNGYFNETNVAVTTYYNRTGAPTTFVALNTTTIPFMVNRTGFKTWTVVWNTSGLPEDRYSISTNASKVTGEKVDLDQYDFAPDEAEVIRHDIAVLGVIAAPTGVTVGETVQVNVTIQNQGVETETFDVRAYANDTLVATKQTVSNLLPLDDRFKVDQTVSPSTAWSPLQPWKDGRGTDTTPFHPVRLGTYSWDDRSEPNDGSWSWIDVQNMLIRFDSDLIGVADNFEIKIYEIWLTVHTSGGTFESRPTTQTISGISVTNPGNAYDADADTYASFYTNADGYVEFKTFSTDVGTITRVDVKIRYSALKVVKVLTFNWDTTAWSTGYYILNGTADLVTGESIETGDNSYENSDVRRRVNIPPIHDVAVVFAYTNQTYAKPGDQIQIRATVQNQGDDNETFTVTPYYESTPAASAQLVSLNARNHTGEDYPVNNTLSFIWDTTGVPLGTYDLWVVASTVSGETDTADNNRTGGRAVFTRLYIDPSRTIKTAADVSDVYQSYPTTHAETGITVTNPLNAYDQNNATYASYLTDIDGRIDFKLFNTSAIGTDVAQVDFKIRYSAAAVSLPHPSLDDKFRINYTVSPSASWGVLQDWNDSTVNIAADDYAWTDRSEPKDGSWNWTDVSNLVIRFDSDWTSPTDRSTSSTDRIRIYEIWLVVNNATSSYISRPSASTVSGITVSYPERAYDASSSTYAYFFNSADGYVEYSGFATDSGAITDVDIIIRYRAYAVSDQFRIMNRVLPTTSYYTVQAYITSDVDWPINTYVYSHIKEVNDNNWTWAEIDDIEVNFFSDVRGNAAYPEGREVRIYEVWATIYDKTFSVDLEVGGVEDLYAFSARVYWDPTVLDFVSVTKGDFLSRNFTSTFIYTINYTGSYVDFGETIMGMNPGETGDGLLATLTFRIKSTGKSPITLSDTELVDSYGNSMDHFGDHGKFNTIPLTGDFDADGDVDVDDLSAFAQVYGSTGSPGWIAQDLNSDGVVDAKDLHILGWNWW